MWRLIDPGRKVSCHCLRSAVLPGGRPHLNVGDERSEGVGTLVSMRDTVVAPRAGHIVEGRPMVDSRGFRLMLEARTGMAFDREETRLAASFAGRQVTVSSYLGESLRDTNRVVFEARGFTTKAEAREYGEKLRTAVQIAGLCALLGVTARPGEDLGWFDVNETDMRGLIILEDVPGLISWRGSGTLLIRANADQFLGAMNDLADQPSIEDPEIGISVRLLNLALVNSEPLGKIVLAVAAIEAAARGPSWSDVQRQILERLAEEVESAAGGNEELLEVAKAIPRLYRNSLRQEARQFLAANGLNHLWRDWDRLYDRRSKLFHGRGRLSGQEISVLAADAVKLCGRIVLAIIKQRGMDLPATASAHFGEI